MEKGRAALVKGEQGGVAAGGTGELPSVSLGRPLPALAMLPFGPRGRIDLYRPPSGEPSPAVPPAVGGVAVLPTVTYSARAA